MAIPGLHSETGLDVLRSGSNSRNTDAAELHELLTVEDVAAILRVSKSWVYEHTRSRVVPRTDRLPCIKLGKYVRFEARAVRAFLEKRSKFA
jgi:excisionase family DNA binding protein